ncbi:MAG: tetratricopeptide repeat protein [Isosphaeraceae bacterium]|nr:tetratricopeptide repeat protein [Isosphaeraceae bacterium]
MTSGVPFHLRRRPEARAALALFLPAPEPEMTTLLTLCVRLGLNAAGRVFAVAGGFLIKLDEPTRIPSPGTVRLCALAEDLFVPVDADLVPALLDDEVSGLTRGRGLLFLPGERVLVFDPARPVDPGSFLTAPARPKRDWRPLPEIKGLPERISEILVVRPDDAPEQLLDAGGENIGTEPPRPPAAGATSNLLGGATLSAGAGMAWLGKTLGIERLAQIGTRWLDDAVARAPRLSEALLGRQAAALRALLQEFREGKLDQALRHALPLSEQGTGRGAGQFPGDQLPPQGTSFSLNDLLEPAGRRAGSIWYGEADVMAELTKEYRKAAEEATRRGEYRRAAFIYGRLLRDYRAAVNVLVRGGMHREAAILLLAKLDDRPGAAREFEAAGELDRALQLYREIEDHEAAGDLLRRIGEEDDALVEFQKAARRIANTAGGHLAAGDLLLTKVGRPDLAEVYFRDGWRNRLQANAVPCALRLAMLCAERGDVGGVFALVDEADELFDGPGHDGNAGLFYNELAKLADQASLAQVREECRDRALLGLAAKMRQRVGTRNNASGILSGLLRSPGEWSATVVSDAEFAAASLLSQPSLIPRTTDAGAGRRLRIGVGVVTAACAAEETGEVFLGFASGEVYCFRPERSEVLKVGDSEMPVSALATETTGRTLVVLRSHSNGIGVLAHYQRRLNGSYRELHGTGVERLSAPLLTQVLTLKGEDMIGVWDGDSLSFLSIPSFAKMGGLALGKLPRRITAAFLIRSLESPEGWAIFCRTDEGWREDDPLAGRHAGANADWEPCVIDESTLRTPPLSLLVLSENADRFHVVGLGKLRSLYWSEVVRSPGVAPSFQTISPPTPTGGFQAATLLPTGHLAGLSRTSVTWFRRGAGKAEIIDTHQVALPSAIACFASHPTRELIVVCRDGFIARVSYPSPLAT